MKEACQAILKATSPSSTVGPEDEAFLRGLVELHQEATQKIGVGIGSIQVEYQLGAKCFWITRTDGSRTDFSYRKILNPPSTRAQALAALRALVWPQVETFRAATLTPDSLCDVTGEPLWGVPVEVDHDPPFEFLIEQFCRKRGIKIDEIKVLPTADGELINKLASPALEADWCEFHARHARLRLVTRHANQIVLTRPEALANRPTPEDLED